MHCLGRQIIYHQGNQLIAVQPERELEVVLELDLHLGPNKLKLATTLEWVPMFQGYL